LPTSKILLDDRILIATLAGEHVALDWRAESFTTSYFYYRACRAFVLGAAGQLSGPFELLDDDRKARATATLLTLPDNIGLPVPRQIVPVMAGVHRRHPHLNVLNTEAAAAALLLDAEMQLSPPTASGQLESVLADEGIAWRIIELAL